MGTRTLFVLGLLIRLILLVIVEPLPVLDWYAPFLEATFFSWDPWQTWLSQSGDPTAFPYGYATWMAFWPLGVLFQLSELPISYSYGLTLLLADITLLFVFYNLLPRQQKQLAFHIYWLSPIIIIAGYLFGYNDLIPALLLMISIFFVKKNLFFGVGFFCILAISAKLSMLLALPFMLIYLLNNKPIRCFLPQFFQGIVTGSILFLLPFAFSSAGLQMLFDNPEMDKIYQLALPFDAQTKIYLIPLMYFLFLYATWRVKRIHFELLHTILGSMFLLIILMTPSSPGWFVWAIPLLSLSLAKNSNATSLLLLGAFSFLYALNTLLLGLPALLPAKVLSLFNTSMAALGIILLVRVYRESIRKNDYFRFMQKPFVLGVSGDSGSGKDTFANAISGLFGKHSVTLLSGDNYHLWDRKRPIWQALTHLNPMANDLERMTMDLRRLLEGHAIYTKHYCHQTGKMGRPQKTPSNEIIISSGLHALYLATLRQYSDLKIYLDTSEEVRTLFKIKRDVNERGHTKERVLSSLKKRESDSLKFIRPQSQYADIIFSLQPISPPVDSNPNLRLVVHSRQGGDERILSRVLIGTCGLRVDALPSENNSETVLTIEGDCRAEDISLAAKAICPNILEFLDIKPHWCDGMMGIMQIITLANIDKTLTRKAIA